MGSLVSYIFRKKPRMKPVGSSYYYGPARREGAISVAFVRPSVRPSRT